MRQQYEEAVNKVPTRMSVRITSRSNKSSHMDMTKSMGAELGLHDGDIITVSAGSYTKSRCRIRVRDIEDIVFTPGPGFKGYLPTPLTLRMSYNSNTRTARIGPIIGIFTIDTHTMFGPQSGTFRDLMRVGRKAGALVYAFTPQDIDWTHKVIRGYIWTGHWAHRTFPMPDVVYNRIPKRIDEAKPLVKHTLKRLADPPYCRLFNAKFLNKWQVHRLLIAKPDMKGVIPTTRWRGSASLASFLAEHNQVFLKPVSDSLGNGAMRISPTKEGYILEVNIPGRGTRRRTIHSIPVLCRLVAALVRSKPYLMQKCITLAKYKGRPFDVRILVQKDGDGCWHTTGMAARVARAGRITTHIPNGGRAQSLPATIKVALPELDAEAIVRSLETLSEEAAAAVDSQQNSLYGEVSLDVGIDMQGNAWIFEVNAKPFRFDEERIRQTALRRVVAYATYLSGLQDREIAVSEAR